MSEPLTTLDIDGIAAGGDGVGRVDGMAVFVPRAAVGDRLTVNLTRSKRFARGVIHEVVSPSSERVIPPCVHYTADRCGGCQLQHVAYDAQLAYKSVIVGDALRRLGRRDVANPEVSASAEQWKYRNKLTLHLRWQGTRWIAGLHPYDDATDVFDLRECPITDDGVLETWAQVREHFALLPRVPALRAAVRRLDHGYSFTVQGGRHWRNAPELLEAVDALTEIWWKGETGAPQLVAQREATHSAGIAFAQVNNGVAHELRQHVLALVAPYTPRTVVDAYAGAGDLALALACDDCRVTALEWDREAVELLAPRLTPPSRAIAGKVEDHLTGALPADVVLLNPPRLGVHAAVTTALEAVRQPPRAIIYTSCDPATLARDLQRMPSYRLVSVRAFDMFPQTAHVETVCELVRVTT